MILGTIDDVHLLNGYPDCLISDIISVLSVLDDNYGSDRKIFEDMGGFIVILDDINDILEISAKWNIDVFSDICESETSIAEYTRKLFILSSDYVICVYA